MVTGMDEPRRLQGYEQEGVYDLCAAVHSLENVKKKIPRRLGDVKDGVSTAKRLATQAQNLLVKVLETIPRYQLLQMQRNLDSLRITVGIARVDTKQKSDFGRWMSYEALTGLMQIAEEHCTLCDKEFDDQIRCPLRRALNELPLDAPEDVKGCPYYAMWVRF